MRFLPSRHRCVDQAVRAQKVISESTRPAASVTATHEKTVVSAAPAESAFPGFTHTLSGNLHHPLSRLLVQLVIVIALVQLAGRVCRLIGQPAVVGEIVTRHPAWPLFVRTARAGRVRLRVSSQFASKRCAC
jgi:hypothetical protein